MPPLEKASPTSLPSHLPMRAEGGNFLLMLDVNWLSLVAKRNFRLIMIIVCAFVALGVAYIVTASPKYTSTTTILIDSRRNQDQIAGTIADLNIDTAAIDSQIEVLRSDKVALGVINILSLDKSGSFSSSGSGVLGLILSGFRILTNIRSWFVAKEIEEEDELDKTRRAIIAVLQQNLVVKRIGRTYVIQISYTSPSGNQARLIADAYAEAYFRDQMEARYEVTKRASGWLQDRIAELKENSLKTDFAVQRFKAEKGIISTGQGMTGGSALLSDQQLTELTTQLSNARAETSRMEAKLEQIHEILKTGKTDGAVAESLGNPVINDFRSRFLRASKTAADLTARVGDKHYQVQSARNEMVQYERLIFEELQRIAETYVSDVEIAKSREKSLNEAMATLIGQKALSNETMVQLRELERESDVFKNLYQLFLQRYQDAIQRESLPTTEARVLSPASYPVSPSEPKALLILIISGILGVFLAAASVYLKEMRDSVFRVGSQVKEELGLEFIGSLPNIPVHLIEDKNEKTVDRAIRPTSSIQRYILEAPLSSNAEVLRNIKVEIDLATAGLNKKHKIIGVVSVFPGEGKTTTSKNLASLLAMSGGKTLLIDGDIRNPGLTRGIAQHAHYGLVDVLRGEHSLFESLLLEPETNLAFLPASIRKRLVQGGELLSSQAMEKLLAEAAKIFEYIIVDLPPIGPVVDVKAAGRFFDAFVLVIEWGKTNRALVRDALLTDPVLYEKCVGVVFNKADIEAMRSYKNDQTRHLYGKNYGSYYIEDHKEG